MPTYLKEVVQYLVDWLAQFVLNLSQHEVVYPGLGMLGAAQREGMGELSFGHLQHAPTLSKSPVFHAGCLVEVWLEAEKHVQQKHAHTLIY